MQKGLSKKIKLIITFVIIVGFIWFLVVSPMLAFHNNEKKLEDAARRYFELNSRELPTGERIATVGLNTLYHKSFIEGDLYVPYTHKTCSIENSWVKVRKVNNEYKYYTYLECGILSSTIDHKGPEISLNGNKVETVGLGEKYTDSGVRSVIDNVDGKLNTKDVTIKGEVDTSEIGTYEIKYIAFDSLKNKTEVVREVKVVQKLNSTIKDELEDSSNYKGGPEDNFLRLSNQMFRIYGIDKNNNIIIVANEDVANVNYSKLDEWLDYYYKNLNSTTQKMIVKTKFCNMAVNDSNNNTTKCTSYTGKKKVYIPSVVEVNKAQGENVNFMRPATMSWVSNPTEDGKKAYLTRNTFYNDEYGKTFLAYDKNENYGVRPMMVIKGDSLITTGDGTFEDPYEFGDVKVANGGSLLNERFAGEYVSIDNMSYRIIKTENDGTTKVISNFTVDNSINASTTDGTAIYNPKKRDNLGYRINNGTAKYVDGSNFVNHKIEVPIYKNRIIYGTEVAKKEYKAVFSAPNMYELFSAKPQEIYQSYWMINSSKGKYVAAMYEVGVPMNEKINGYATANTRIVGYLKKDIVVSSGSGTINDPYVVK